MRLGGGARRLHQRYTLSSRTTCFGLRARRGGKCIFVGADIGSINELGRMESPGSKRRYREENYSRKQQLCSSGAHGSLRVTGVGNGPSNRTVALTDGKKG
jgi:hypothetical protein